MTTYSVLDFGAKADGVSDDSHAVAATVKAAITLGHPATVLLPTGRYRLHTAMSTGMIAIEDASDLTVTGEPGTLIVSSDPTKHMVHVVRSNNIVVRQMEMDRNPYVFTQGWIDSVDHDGSAVDVTIDDGYDEPDAKFLDQLSGLHVWTDPASHAWDQTEWGPVITAKSRIAPMRWRFELSKASRIEFLGKPFVIWDNRYKGWGVVCTQSENVTVEDVRYYGGGADAGMAVWGCHGDITYRRFTVGVPDGSGRRFAAAGGSQQFNNRGTLLIEDCDISRVDDDGVNMGTIFCRILSQPDARTLLVENDAEPFAISVAFRSGDTVALWDWKQKKQHTEAKIVTATADSQHCTRIVLDRDVAAKMPADSEGLPRRQDFNGPGRFEQFDGIDRIASFEAAGKLIVRNCRFQNFRARNILIKTSDSLIEGNIFYDTNMASIIVGPEFYWGEAPAVRNLAIRNNRFLNISGSSIDIGCHPSETSYDNKNILIEGNTFEHYGAIATVNQAGRRGTAVHVRNADGVTIRGNKFLGASPTAPAGVKPVLVEVSQNVTVQDNEGIEDFIHS